MPRTHARIAGLFYLLNFVTGALGIPANAANLAANQSLFLVGFVGYALNVITYLVVTVMLYELFKPRSPTRSLLAAAFSFTGCAIQGAACLFQLGALAVAKDQSALAQLCLTLHARGYVVGLVFFGCYCAALGGLILETKLLPWWIGALMLLAGLGWLTFLWPPFAMAHAFVRLPGIVGEATLMLWLLVGSYPAEHDADDGVRHV